MNKEEKEAIDRIQKRIKDNEDYSTNQVWLTEDVRCARVILNLIQKQEKIIDKMAEQLAGLAIWNDNIEEALILGDKEEVKEYFKKVVDEDVKD